MHGRRTLEDSKRSAIVSLVESTFLTRGIRSHSETISYLIEGAGSPRRNANGYQYSGANW